MAGEKRTVQQGTVDKPTEAKPEGKRPFKPRKVVDTGGLPQGGGTRVWGTVIPSTGYRFAKVSLPPHTPLTSEAGRRTVSPHELRLLKSIVDEAVELMERADAEGTIEYAEWEPDA